VLLRVIVMAVFAAAAFAIYTPRLAQALRFVVLERSLAGLAIQWPARVQNLLVAGPRLSFSELLCGFGQSAAARAAVQWSEMWVLLMIIAAGAWRASGRLTMESAVDALRVVLIPMASAGLFGVACTRNPTDRYTLSGLRDIDCISEDFAGLLPFSFLHMAAFTVAPLITIGAAIVTGVIAMWIVLPVAVSAAFAGAQLVGDGASQAVWLSVLCLAYAGFVLVVTYQVLPRAEATVEAMHYAVVAVQLLLAESLGLGASAAVDTHFLAGPGDAERARREAALIAITGAAVGCNLVVLVRAAADGARRASADEAEPLRPTSPLGALEKAEKAEKKEKKAVRSEAEEMKEAHPKTGKPKRRKCDAVEKAPLLDQAGEATPRRSSKKVAPQEARVDGPETKVRVPPAALADDRGGAHATLSAVVATTPTAFGPPPEEAMLERDTVPLLNKTESRTLPDPPVAAPPPLRKSRSRDRPPGPPEEAPARLRELPLPGAPDRALPSMPPPPRAGKLAARPQPPLAPPHTPSGNAARGPPGMRPGTPGTPAVGAGSATPSTRTPESSRPGTAGSLPQCPEADEDFFDRTAGSEELGDAERGVDRRWR